MTMMQPLQLPDNHWYPVLASREVRRRPLGVQRLGMRLVFWRDSRRQVHALDERCPHLGAALSHGHVAGDCIECPFHGFRFAADGRCTQVPALGMHGLDVSHLAFVHRTTIGAGGRSMVEGPHVETDATGIRVWVTNRRDDGSPPRDAAELAAAAQGREPGLHLLFPGVWLLNIGARFRNLIAFVPINEQCTRYYLRSYSRVRFPVLARPLHWLASISNRVILEQDRRVVVTQPVGSSLSARDMLLPTDRAIIEYRRWLARHVQGECAPVARA